MLQKSLQSGSSIVAQPNSITIIINTIFVTNITDITITTITIIMITITITAIAIVIIIITTTTIAVIIIITIVKGLYEGLLALRTEKNTVEKGCMRH